MIALDSDFIIDFLRNRKEAIRKYNELKNETFVTTQINFFEILFGVYRKKELQEKEEKITLEFFDNLTLLNLDKTSAIKSARIAGELVSDGLSVEPNDCLISGILLSNGCSRILTRNKDHFSRIKEIKIESF